MEDRFKDVPAWARFSTLLLKGCHKKQEIVGNTFRMFGLGS